MIPPLPSLLRRALAPLLLPWAAHFQAVAMRMPPQEPARALRESALQRADEVLVEGRDRVRGLRSAAGDAPALAYLPQPRRPRWRFWQGGDDNTEQAA